MHGRPAKAGGFGVQLGAQRGVALRQFVKAVHQCLEVQHGAADQQRQPDWVIQLAPDLWILSRTPSGSPAHRPALSGSAQGLSNLLVMGPRLPG